MSYFVYILESEATGKRYTGYTKDVEKRLRRHNSGHVKSTQPHRPYRLIYSEKYESIVDAKKRELQLKRKKGSGIYCYLKKSKG